MRFTRNDQRHYALAGGLDLMTPPIAVQPGRVSDAQNYEPEISGGYRRIDGYERYDGRPSPTSAPYWIVNYTAGAVAATAGMTLIGATSGATARVLGVFGGYLVLGRVSGTFQAGENITSGGTVGTLTSLASQNAALLPSDHADYLLLAANDLRADIQAVPGSGRIRGVAVYRDIVYAFRDNAGGTAGAMYKVTTSGWSQVTFGWEIQFNAGTAAINVGDVIGNLGTGATSTCAVLKVLVRTGSFGSAGAGSLIVTQPTGPGFLAGGGIFVGSSQKATVAVASTQITRAPGGAVETVVANFTGSTDTKKLYGADGVNPAFEFDGTNYIPIRTGMATDTPSHVIEHRNYLALSFLGSVQLSAVGNPYSWTVVLGAQEIGMGDVVTGFIPAAGSASGGAALAIFTKGKTSILYGASSGTFQLVPSKYDLGIAAGTAQAVSNDIYGLTARGIQALTTTLDYGDFDYASVSHQIQPLMTAKRGKETVSTTLKGKNQYRLYFNDGTGIVVGLTGQKVSGILPINYGRVVRCMTTAELSTGQEVTFFGSDDGYVYQDNVGTSFDGQPIEAWLRTHFNSLGDPMMRKRMRRAVLEVYVTSYAQVNISYDFGYGNPDVLPAAATVDKTLTGGGGYWDGFTWDSFSWDAQAVNNPVLSIEGTEKNISFTFYSNRAQDGSHTVQGLTFISSPRRAER
jgi:hypothetical protein